MPKFNLTHKKFYGWFIWAIVASFYSYRYLLEVSPAVMVHELMRSLSADAAILGNLTAFFLYAYASVQLPAGILLDRFGVRKLLTAAALICVLGNILFGGAHFFALAALGRLLTGLGAAFAMVGCLCIAAKWLPVNRFALATGLMVAIGMAGAIGGSAPLAWLVVSVHWRDTLFILGSGGFIFALLMWIFIREKPKNNTSTEADTPKVSILTGLKYVIRNKQSWLLAIYAGFLFMPITVFGSLWGVPFLMHKYNCSSPHAATLIIALFVGLAFGSPFFGWLSDYICRRKVVLYVSSFGMAISTLILLYCPHLPQFLASVMLFGFGAFAGASFVAFATIVENNPKEYAGTTLGYMNMMNMIGGAVGQPIIGVLLDWQWQGKMAAGVRVYTLANFEIALAILPAAMILSLVFLPWIKETFCREVGKKSVV